MDPLGSRSDGLVCDETVELADLNGWSLNNNNSRQQLVNFREQLGALVRPGDTIILRSLTYLLAFLSPCQVATGVYIFVRNFTPPPPLV